MSKQFKNALCLAPLPDAITQSWHMECHRRALHGGLHRVRFRDGKYRVWASGDSESRIVSAPPPDRPHVA